MENIPVPPSQPSLLSEIMNAIDKPAGDTQEISTAAERKPTPSPKKKSGAKGSAGEKKGGGRVTTPDIPQQSESEAVAAPKSADKKRNLPASAERKGGGRITTPVEGATNAPFVNLPPRPSSPSASDRSSNFDDLDVDMAPRSTPSTSPSHAGGNREDSDIAAAAAAAATSTPSSDHSGMSIRDRLNLRKQAIKEKSGKTPVKQRNVDEVLDFNTSI